ncbi:MAG: flagellar motor protein MotB [Actinomycetota bacterium]|nr:flagellar motor protein MotB [Actinomycetota bacterium]
MRLKRKNGNSSENTDRWLTTYSDMITNLLVFFVLLYSISMVDLAKFKEIATTLSSAFGTGFIEFIDKETKNNSGKNEGGSSPVIIFDRFVPPVIKDVEKIGEDFYRGKTDISEEDLEKDKVFVSDDEAELLGIARDIKNKITDANLGENVSITIEDGVLIIRIKSEGVLFESGSAELKSNILPLLNIITDSLKFYRGLIMVEGHTDNVPINTIKYPSNWELSTARAVSVLKYWINNKMVLPTDIVAAGYADTKPIDTNETEEGRAKNRRVEILILGREQVKAYGR